MMNFDWQEGQIMGVVKFIRTIFGDKSWIKIAGDVRHGLSQLFLLDDLERRTHYLRPREADQGATTKVWRTVGERVAAAQDGRALKKVKKELFAELDAIKLDPTIEPLRVGLLGEFFMALEPFCNHDIEEELGKMRVEVTRGPYLSNWAKDWLFLEAISMNHGGKVKKAASPYLSRDVSGDAVASLGETILHAQEGFDGIVHLQPFTCMPEIIAQNMFPRVSRDFDIPVLCLILDEQMGKAGLQTRLEAFVEMMGRRRTRRNNNGNGQLVKANGYSSQELSEALKELSTASSGHCDSSDCSNCK
jgi:predicted nucleotide-binding protein (sugar kinase/HSP70/actin superfamily)